MAQPSWACSQPVIWLIANVWERTRNVTSQTVFCSVFSILIQSDAMPYNIFDSYNVQFLCQNSNHMFITNS
jgi:hypothetical protein